MARNSSAVEGATVSRIGSAEPEAESAHVPVDRRVALKFKEAAELLSISEDSIRRAVNEGKLPAVRIIGGVRIRRADLDPYLEAYPFEPAA